MAEVKAGLETTGTRIGASPPRDDGFIAMECHAQPSFFLAK